jgi:hypothetical protein
VSTNTVDPDGWETIGEESGILVKWEKPGDTFTGIFQGTRHIVPPNSDDPDDEFDQQMFRSNEDGTDAGDILFVHNGGYKVREALTDDYIGWLVRMTFVKTVPVQGQASPMNDVKVQAKRI